MQNKLERLRDGMKAELERIKFANHMCVWHAACNTTTNMKKLTHILISLLIVVAQPSYAQQNAADADTMYSVQMKEVKVTGERNWQNDTVRYRYNQMKYYVKTILPYLKEATTTFSELNNKINDPSVGKRERKAFVHAKEDAIKDKFEADIKKLNETQGMLLMKLIGRQTGVNLYEMLKEFKNPLTAIKWQTYARFNGFNINKKYTPEDEPMLEHIMESLGYPLPEHIYGYREIPTVQNK
ncbi:MAG: DUF4294 domain-containing protein [Sphingobacteriales bacterium]|nr:MAG: DUF4294 domain-containing protein [Sphingobacteriales bacterium]